MNELLNREMDAFRLTSPERRDGMLVEATRELADAAARRAGSAAVLAEALNATADLMQEARMAAAPPPNEPELAAAFEQSRQDAAQKWQTLAEHRDPMGKELEFHTRLRTPAR